MKTQRKSGVSIFMASFEELVSAFSHADELMESDDFDPQAIAADLAAKVDGLQYVLSRMEAVSGHLAAEAKALGERAKRIAANRDRLKDHIKYTMEQNNEHTLLGSTYRVRLRPASQESIEIEDATEAHYLRHPGYVSVERVFKWDKKTLKSDIQSGKLVPDFNCKISRNNYIKFEPITAKK